MSLFALAVIAVAVLTLVAVGVVVGWMIGTNHRQVNILERRLAADAVITRATRDALHAVRDVVRNRNE